MKRKKFWIAFSIIVCVVFIIVMVFSFGFRLKTVDVEFWQRSNAETTKLENGILDKVKTDGEFSYGKNMFTLRLSSNIEKIEKTNPYVKVWSAKKHFPNIVRIHIVERVPLFRIRCEEDDQTWLILDDEFKILDNVSADDLSSSEFYSTTIEVDPNTLTIPASYELGDFVELDNNYEEYLISISDGVYGKTTDSASAASISILAEEGTFVFSVYMRNETQEGGKGALILVYGTKKLKELVYAGVSVFEEEKVDNSTINLPTTTFTVKLVNGEINVTQSS